MKWLDRLAPRERWYLRGVLTFVALMAIIQFFYLPLQEAGNTFTRGIAAQEKVLQELLLQVAAYEKLKNRADEFQRRLTSRPKDFSIFSHVEKQAAEAGVKGSIRSMTVQRGTSSGAYEEVPLDIRLEKVTLKQLTQFLALLESPEAFLQVKKLTVSRMKDAPGYLAAWMQVATYQQRSGAPAPKGGGAP